MNDKIHREIARQTHLDLLQTILFYRPRDGIDHIILEQLSKGYFQEIFSKVHEEAREANEKSRRSQTGEEDE